MVYSYIYILYGLLFAKEFPHVIPVGVPFHYYSERVHSVPKPHFNLQPMLIVLFTPDIRVCNLYKPCTKSDITRMQPTFNRKG